MQRLHVPPFHTNIVMAITINLIRADSYIKNAPTDFIKCKCDRKIKS